MRLDSCRLKQVTSLYSSFKQGKMRNLHLKTWSKFLTSSFCNLWTKVILEKQVSTANLPSLCTNESQVWLSVLTLMCIWFPAQACFRRFSRILWFSLLHLKLGFLNKSVSVCFLEASIKFDACALLRFAWLCTTCN